MRRVGLLGGTFDPFHNGHLDTGHAAQTVLHLTELIVVVSNLPPHRPQPLASSHHRFAMVALGIAGRPGWRASDIELANNALSFTTDTLGRFHQAGYAAEELFFVIGADAFAEIESWKDYPALLDLAHFVVVSRPGASVTRLAAMVPALQDRMTTAPAEDRPGRTSIFLIDATTADVSATAIRNRAAGGGALTGLVPPAVQQHIEQHRLYSSSPAPEEAAGGVHVQRISPAGRLHGQD